MNDAPAQPRWRRRALPLLAAATVLVVVAIVVVLVVGDDDDVIVDAATGDDPSRAVVAVTYGEASVVSAVPSGLTLRFLDADGAVVAEREWSEVEEPVEGGAAGERVVQGGLVQEVPPGDLQLEATLGTDVVGDAPTSCTQPFTAAAGDRLILHLQLGPMAPDAGPGADPACATIETVEDWSAGRTSAAGERYVDLTLADAESQAASEGITTRVVAADGMGLVITDDLQTSRLDLMVFDGVVVAAQLGGEDSSAPVPDGDAEAGAGTVAVDLEPVEGYFIEGFDVTLVFLDAGGEQIAEHEWSDAVAEAGGAEPGIDAYYTHVLRQEVPAGPVRLVTWVRLSPGGAIPPAEGPGCQTALDVVQRHDTLRVTLLFSPDEAGGACAAVTAATAAADELLALPRGLPAPGFVGLALPDAEAVAADRGWTLRVVADDGEGLVRTEDYSTERVNVVVEDGVVTAAARS